MSNEGGDAARRPVFLPDIKRCQKLQKNTQN